jgi:cobalt/nickel transport protein
MFKKNYFGLFLLALFIGGILSPFASSQPDGLEKVAEDQGFISSAISLFDGFIPDYIFPGIGNEFLATSLAGFLGSTIVFLIFSLLGKGIIKTLNNPN